MNCNHGNCNCSDASYEKDGKSYCSQACADGTARATAAGGCGCGHSGCAKEKESSKASSSFSGSKAGGLGAPGRDSRSIQAPGSGRDER